MAQGLTSGIGSAVRSDLSGRTAGMAPCYREGMAYDPTRLAQLGKRHQRLTEDLKTLRPELHDEIRAAHDAEVPQVEIVKLTGYTRDQVRQICLPPERRRLRGKAAE